MPLLPHKATYGEKIRVVTLGIVFFLLALELGLRVVGFLFVSFQSYQNRRALAKKNTYRILCLGESTTAGQYPSFLQETLNQRHIGVTFSVIDKGVIGADTSVILRRLEENLATYKPDMVVAMMGFNDRRIVYYNDIPEAGTPLFQHCKAYRLLRLLSTRLAKKFKNTVDPNPKNIQAYRSLLRVYLSQGKISAAEKTLRQGIEHDSRNDCLYVEMAEFYWRQGNLLRAEEALQRLLILSPHSDFAHRTIEDFYRKTNRIELAGKYKERREELRLNEYRAATVKNYRKLKEILDALKIRLVCAQYPMRNLEPLKGVFAGENSIVFVDNEKIFKDAVEKVNYQEYFRDKFGGDFGHCTEKGNRLLAENIANTILREVFGK